MKKFIIKSAKELTIEQKDKLEKQLSKKNNEKAEFKYIIDDIVGGIVIFDGEKMIDGSMSKELGALKDSAYKLITEIQEKADLKGKESTQEIIKRLSEDLTKKRSGKDYSAKEVTGIIRNNLTRMLKHEIDVTVCGRVIFSADGVIRIDGLSTCKYGELLVIKKSIFAIAMNLETDNVGAILLDNADSVDYGDVVYTTGKIVEVPVGNTLLGRVVNPLGQPIDGGAPLHTNNTRHIEFNAPSIIDREKVTQPLCTGILSIDSMIPIGKGQRELIIGDRQTGKTAIALDTILNQKGKDVNCIYVAIGQRASAVAKIIKKLKDNDALKYTTLVVSTADESAPLQYIAPYTGCAIAEEWMYKGKDVLIVYDDLSKHAVAYRSISLLLKRPAGREAYPGDVFYIHSRLLERAAKLNSKQGGGSMTALPIIETLAGDISAYIPTNVISITDGQIYLETELFNAGFRPAINVGLSVSRVGGSAQCNAIKTLSSKLRLELAHYRELALFSQFGSDLDSATKAVLARGERAIEALKQHEFEPMDIFKEILYLYVISKGFLNRIPVNLITDYLDGFYKYYRGAYAKEANSILKTNELTQEIKETIDYATEQFVAYFEEEKYK